jgi:hemerythrin
MYKWTSDLSVGNHLIDSEHQHLFGLLDNFYESLKGKQAPMDLLALIKGLLDYAEVHFADEEAYMIQVDYPEINKHQQLHRDFMLKATDFYDKLKSGKLLLTLEVTNFIKDWLVSHIKGEDMKVVKFAKVASKAN